MREKIPHHDTTTNRSSTRHGNTSRRDEALKKLASRTQSEKISASRPRRKRDQKSSTVVGFEFKSAVMLAVDAALIIVPGWVVCHIDVDVGTRVCVCFLAVVSVIGKHVVPLFRSRK